MKAFLGKAVQIIGGAVLVGALVYEIWQPVVPSKWIVKRMAQAVNREHLPTKGPLVVRFELAGKGGGMYSIVADKGAVTMLEGTTDNVDLVMYMEAADFNNLMLSLANGKADEYTFKSLIISKVISFAGDMGVFSTLFSKEGGNT